MIVSGTFVFFVLPDGRTGVGRGKNLSLYVHHLCAWSDMFLHCVDHLGSIESKVEIVREDCIDGRITLDGHEGKGFSCPLCARAEDL